MTRNRLLLTVAAALAVGLAAPHAWAWHHLRTGRAALAAHHPADAGAALDRTLGVWPDRPDVRLLASRAARQVGDFDAAERHLRDAQRRAGGATDATAFEWALLQAAGGNVREVDEYLQRRADADPESAPLASEALAEGYLLAFRTLDAMAVLDGWLARSPDDVRALELRGMTFVTGRGVRRGADDFRRAVDLDPTRADARLRLVGCLLDLGAYDEAVPHLHRLLAARPADPGLRVRLARCQGMLGRGAEARRTLDEVLADHPSDGQALRTRGQLALGDQLPAEAEGWLRRAAEVLPADYQTHWLLFQALQQQGKTVEAADRIELAERVRDRSERLAELRSRKLPERPLDPGLHAEMGVLLVQAGQRGEAGRWFRSALDLDPDHRPAHAGLAEVYEQGGDPARAAAHRRKAEK